MAVVHIAPRDIAHAVVVEIADPDRDRACRMRSNVDAAGPLPIHDQPHVYAVGRRIVPGNVAGAVQVEVTRPERLPTGGMAAEIDAALSSWFSDARTGWKGNPHFANRAFWRDMMRHALIAAHAARITIYADTPRRIAPHDRDDFHPSPTGLPTRPRLSSRGPDP